MICDFRASKITTVQCCDRVNAHDTHLPFWLCDEAAISFVTAPLSPCHINCCNMYFFFFFFFFRAIFTRFVRYKKDGELCEQETSEIVLNVYISCTVILANRE